MTVSLSGRILGLATLSLAFAATPVFAQTTAPTETRPQFSAQDLVTMPRLGSPAASPDGTWVAYTVTTTDPKTYKRTTKILLQHSTEGPGTSIALRFDGSASSPSFASDGTLYFTAAGKGSEGENANQLWHLAIPESWKGRAGRLPHARQITHFARDIAGYKISPDSRKLLVWGDVARECPSLDCTIEGDRSRAERGSGRIYDSTDGFVRHWDQWETPGEYSRAFAYTLTSKGVSDPVAIDGPNGESAFVGDTPSKPFGGGEELNWSADSASVFFTARHSDISEPTSTNLDIYQTYLATGEPVNQTGYNRATDTQPTPSPDGKWLAWLAMKRPAYESDRLVIYLRNLQTGDSRALTGDFDRSFSSISWTPDSQAIIATAADTLDVPAFRVNRDSGKVEKLDLVEGDEAHIGNVIPLARNSLIFTRDSIADPAELYITHGQDKAMRITDIAHSTMAALAPVQTRRFAFSGAGGDTVHGQITKPANASGKLPAILYVHGGPQGSFNDSWSSRWNPAVLASQGYAVISVDFHGSTGYGQAFTDAINQDWGGKPLKDLQLGLAAALKDDPQIDGNRACAMGASYGGFMMNWIEGNWPDRFKCIVQHDGLFDMRSFYYVTEESWFPRWDFGGSYTENPTLYEKWNPVNYVKNWKTPMLVVTGLKDFRVPHGQALAAFTALRENDVPAKLLVFPDENHWVLKPENSLQWHKTVFSWLDKWLKP
ncbi:S9 family peptidase [Altericroceibacterium spongiae]|uniref:S9 family peptidase n=1 Tax=Altericroceibacterium spongiae TaxID=2320269 RepID=A0A420EEB3_9SPHN|nr:S9 family peptidase [Altericroceibacterium spongiae]RKF19035.1 S9 family peptidase [Altericroceibacterium spongiae]